VAKEPVINVVPQGLDKFLLLLFCSPSPPPKLPSNGIATRSARSAQAPEFLREVSP
jgi:hypothetical protein